MSILKSKFVWYSLAIYWCGMCAGGLPGPWSYVIGGCVGLGISFANRRFSINVPHATDKVIDGQ